VRALVLGLFVAGMIEPRAARAGACPSRHLDVAPTGDALPTNVTLRVMFDGKTVN
jgi:hypothetical protein